MEFHEVSFNMQGEILDFLKEQGYDSDRKNNEVFREITENPNFKKLIKNIMSTDDSTNSFPPMINISECFNTLGYYDKSPRSGVDEDDIFLGNVVNPNEIFIADNNFVGGQESASNEPSSRDMSLGMNDLHLTQHSDELYSSSLCMSQNTSSFSKRERQKDAKTLASKGFSHDHPYTQDVTSSDQLNGRLDQNGSIFPSYESMSRDNPCDPLPPYNEQLQCDYPNAHSSSSSLNNFNYESSNISHLPEESALDFNHSQYALSPYEVKLEIESPNSYGSPTNSYTSSPAPQTPFYSHYDSDATASVPSPSNSFNSPTSVRAKNLQKGAKNKKPASKGSKKRDQRMSLNGWDEHSKHERIRDQNNRASREYRDRRKERDSELLNEVNDQELLKSQQMSQIKNIERKKLILQKLLQIYKGSSVVFM